MKPGDFVEVRQVWAASPRGPLYSWFTGYEFVRPDGADVIVKPLVGLYAGLDVRYPADRVRAVSP